MDPKEEVQAPAEEQEPVETENLPPAEDQQENVPAVEALPVESAEERAHRLEIENAELRGRAASLKEVATGGQQAQGPSQQDQWKAQVMADVNRMEPEDFKAKYGYLPHQATTAILQDEFSKKTAENDRRWAQTSAENRLVARFGKEFYDHKEEIDELVAMASPEVRQDPEKLAKLMEKGYLGATAGKKSEVPPAPKGQPVKRSEDMRRIVSSMERPNAKPPAPKKESDEIAPEYRTMASKFGITSEKERKALKDTSYIEMNLGSGKVFRDPAKGVEKVA